MRKWSVDDVMTRAVVSVDETTSYRAVVDLLIQHRVSAVPVVDAGQRVVGVVSEADLLRKIEYAGDERPRLFDGRRRRDDRVKATASVAADLMSAPPITVPAGTSIAAAARLMEAERVKRLPVVDDLGRAVGIVTRGDLLKVHVRTDDEIRADIERDVLRPYLIENVTTVTVTVTSGVVALGGRVDRRSAGDMVARLTRQVPGVVDVVSTIEFAFDDSDLPASGVFDAEPRQA